MKTLQDHMILFDAECPMCRAYTKALVKTGMLDQNGRAAYQSEMHNFCPVIDKQKAVDEIALIDLKNGEVTYGVKSLFKILGNAWPIFRPLFSFKPFEWLMSKLYAFISYNRRVIIPAAKTGDAYAYQPTFKIQYRLAYLLFTWFFTGFILTRYTYLLADLIATGGPYREYLICAGQIVFQGIIISTFAKNKLWDYLGNMMTISFAGSLLLLLGLAASHWFYLPSSIYACYFICVALLMFLEHIRRTSLLGLGWTLTFTWAFYRMALLGLILFF